jgi:hypothetical protein
MNARCGAAQLCARSPHADACATLSLFARDRRTLTRHLRSWAMLGAAGVLVPELLTKAGVADLPTWAEAGHAEYFTDPVTLVLVQFILFNWVEVLRWKDMKNPGSVHEVRRNCWLVLAPLRLTPSPRAPRTPSSRATR